MWVCFGFVLGEPAGKGDLVFLGSPGNYMLIGGIAGFPNDETITLPRGAELTFASMIWFLLCIVPGAYMSAVRMIA
jgi:hypothetical protein